MRESMHHTRVIVLAAGKSTRMKSGAPKVLMSLGGKPMIAHILHAIKASGTDPKPIIVIGHQAALIKSALGEAYEYVLQKDQLGTAHAVQIAKSLLEHRTENVIVLYGDHPLLTAHTIKKLETLHRTSGATLSILTTTVPNFNDWRGTFSDFGRIVRDTQGHIQKIIEAKDATVGELALREVNPGFYCFRASWLWDHLGAIKNSNAQKELYLVDLVRLAVEEGISIASAAAEPEESIGINTPEQFKLAEHFFALKKSV